MKYLEKFIQFTLSFTRVRLHANNSPHQLLHLRNGVEVKPKDLKEKDDKRDMDRAMKK